MIQIMKMVAAQYSWLTQSADKLIVIWWRELYLILAVASEAVQLRAVAKICGGEERMGPGLALFDFSTSQQ